MIGYSCPGGVLHHILRPFFVFFDYQFFTYNKSVLYNLIINCLQVAVLTVISVRIGYSRPGGVLHHIPRPFFVFFDYQFFIYNKSVLYDLITNHLQLAVLTVITVRYLFMS